MGILLWLLFGAIVGWLASIITRDNAGMGIIGNIIIGLIGSALGGWLASEIGIGSYAKFSLGGLVISVLGAVLLLFIIGMLRGRRR